MRKETFVTGECYHVFNRGVDKREIFLDTEDHQRFLHNMYELNDTRHASPFVRRVNKSTVGHSVSYRTPSVPELEQRPQEKREKFVDIFCYCLMPNHFHFILKQLRNGGIPAFLHKLSMGYAKYFNLKYERTGALFQGVFKAVLIETDPQIMHLSRYIHVLNPGELVEPDIREGNVRDRERLDIFLKKYKWSSYFDYLDIKNYPSLINQEFLRGYFKDEKEFEKFSLGWKREELGKIESLFIE